MSLPIRNFSWLIFYITQIVYTNLFQIIKNENFYRAYLTFTCYGIVEDRLLSLAPETTRLTERHTAVNLSTVLESCIANWGLTGKVVVAVTDNEANIKKAVKDYLRIDHHSCAAHVLNLCVNDGIKKIKNLKNVIEKCRKIVGFLKSSVVASDTLDKIQNDANQNTLKLLIYFILI